MCQNTGSNSSPIEFVSKHEIYFNQINSPGVKMYKYDVWTE